MAREQDYQDILDRIAALRETVTDQLAPQLIQNPQLADVINKQLDDMIASVFDADSKMPVPPDKGLAELIGIGPEAAILFGKTRMPEGVAPYDETVTSERIIAVADLYYIYQHERIGVFRAIGSVRARARLACISSTAEKYCVTRSGTGWLLTGERSVMAARLFPRARGRIRISTGDSVTSSIRSHCFGGTSAYRMSYASELLIPALEVSQSCAEQGWIYAIT